MNANKATAPGAWITMQFSDAQAALGYLVDVVGFVEHIVHRGDGDRDIQHAELLWPPGGGMMIGSDAGEGRWSGPAGAPGSHTAYLATPEVEQVARRVADAGWRVIRPLAGAENYDNREIAFLDPEGNAWSVGTYPGGGF